MILAVYLYLGSDAGIVVNFDDAFYAASIAKPLSSLTGIPWGAASFGFFAMGRIFYIFTGSLFTATTAEPITAILLTMITLYMIGRRYGSRLGGISAAVLFAFNPLVYTYSLRLLPDLFITMLLSFAILMTIYVKKRSYAYFACGLVVGLGIFFGVQVLLSLLAYLIFAVSLVYVKKSKKKVLKILYAAFGIAIAIALFLLVQELIFRNPFFVVNGFETFNIDMMPIAPHNNYYFYVLFPISNVGSLAGSGMEPYSTLGILSVVFIGANIILLYKKRFDILPYTFASAAFVLYILFGTENISSYLPILHMNRLLLPIVLLFSIGSGLALGLARRKIQAFPVIAFLTFYVVTSFQYYGYAVSYYNHFNRNQYLATEQISNYLNTLNLNRYNIQENVTQLSTLLCASLKSTPVSCTGGPTPVKGINCTEKNTILVLDVPYCGNTFVFSNRSLSYYIYKNA